MVCASISDGYTIKTGFSPSAIELQDLIIVGTKIGMISISPIALSCDGT